jgi:hypothetical protein
MGLLLSVLDEQEAASARLAQLEARRRLLQERLEREQGLSGLRSILVLAEGAGPDADPDRDVVDRLRASVAALRAEQAQAIDLLGGAALTAARTRAYLLQLVGATPAYGPVGPAREAMPA